MPAYDSTTVPVARSQEELRGLLLKFGADQFTMGEGADWAGLEFVHSSTLVRLRCPLRSVDEVLANDSSHKSKADKLKNAAEHERARVWRVLVWSVKARLVAVEEGLESFEEAFLSHIVNPATQRTIWQGAQEAVSKGVFRVGGPGLPELMAAPRG